jgi:hypothetical protein
VLNVNEIYDTISDTWTTGAPMPTTRWCGASAVVNNVLYAMGGEVGHTLINVVEAYDPATDTWSTKAPLPMAMNSVYAVVDGGIVFTIGGYNDASVRVPAVEIYNPATDQWTEGAPLNVGKSLAAVGVFRAEIIAAGALRSRVMPPLTTKVNAPVASPGQPWPRYRQPGKVVVSRRPKEGFILPATAAPLVLLWPFLKRTTARRTRGPQGSLPCRMLL